MRLLILALIGILCSCGTVHPIYFSTPYAGDTLNVKVGGLVESWPTLNKYQYYLISEQPNSLLYLWVETSYPIPEGSNVYLAFDSVEVNTPRRGNIKNVRYMYRKKRR